MQDSNKAFTSVDQTVSVIIVNYNAGALLSRCVASVLSQSAEVIIVDNASADFSTVAIASQWPHIKIIKNDSNLGFATACNIGVRVATGSHFLFLNPDCVLSADAVQRMLEATDLFENVGMVGGLLVEPDGTEQGGARRAVPTPWRSFVRATGFAHFSDRWPRLFYDFYLHKQPLPAAPVEVEAISGACMLMSRHALEKVGFWDEAYFLHCEDLDLCMRFQRMDLKILFVPSARIVHEKGACSHHRRVFVEWHKHKGMLRFYRKFFRYQYPGVLMGLVTVGVWLRFGLVFTYYSSKYIGRKLGLVRD